MPASKLLTAALVPALALGALALTGCGETTVTRTSSAGAKDLSGRWNDVDSKKVAAEIKDRALKAAWPDRYIDKNKKNPTVVLGKLIVRADGEVINTDIILKDLRNEFINSGKIDVLDDAEQTRAILADQAGYADKAKEMGKELAADYVLKGSINVQNDSEGRQAVKFYVVDFELTDIQTRKIVWADRTDPIRKEVEQSRWK